MSDLQGKTALITGSTSGIGKAVAEALAQQGVNIILNGRRPAAEVEAQRVELETTYGIKAVYYPADMAKPGDIAKMFKAAAKTVGKPDILVNNAGAQYVSPIDQFPPEEWKRIIDVHLVASFLSMREAIPHMKEQGWGRIINVASAHAVTASPFKSAYVAAKHGLLGLTKSAALEVAEQGVTCNAICPGYVWTPLVEGQIAKQAETREIKPEQVINEVFMRVHPTRKFTTVEQIGETAVFLCSSAAQNITGQNINMDGGWTAGQVPLKQAGPAPK